MKTVIAFDLGASSIRAYLAKYENEEIQTEEILRFKHNIINEDGRFRWDFKLILGQIIETIKKYNYVDAIAIDTWGVDFGALDKEGNLLFNPISYRDRLHDKALNDYKNKYDLYDLFKRNGNQILAINSIFQLYALKDNYEDFTKIDTILFMPDLLNYYLCGEKACEESILSTAGICDLDSLEIDKQELNNLGLSANVFKNITKAPKVLGSLKNSLISELRAYDIKVINILSHDTASAIMMSDANKDNDTAFLSCGTWSIIGCVNDRLIRTKEAYEYNLSHELAYDSSKLLFKNLNGLYLLNKLLDEMAIVNNKRYSYEYLNDNLKNKQYEFNYIDIEEDKYSNIDNNLFDLLKVEFPNKEDLEYIEIIYNSLCYKYKETLDTISKISNRKFNRLHVVGGGVNNIYLMQKIADYTNLEIIAGASEASTYGNILMQLLALGEIKDPHKVKKLLTRQAGNNIYRRKNGLS